MKIKFCGADREVTGSAHLITLKDGYKILLDCGLYQGNNKEMAEFNETWLFNPAEINCLVLSHAHIDHCGRIPKLVKDGFTGTIYSTPATRSLCAVMLLDSAGIQERDAEYANKHHDKRDGDEKEPLYTTEDVAKAMGLFVNYNYEHWFKVHEGVDVMFRDAGHILGSASVTLHIKEDERLIRLGFSGDIGRPNRPILRDPLQMPEVDYLLCESTYGDRDHPSAPEEMEKFLEVLHTTCIERRGKVIIPAFSVGRTQEIVYMMDKLFDAGRLPKVPVYVDSPLAVNATEVFIGHPECFDEELLKHMVKDPDPFGFNSLKYIRDVEESKSLNNSNEPCIIVSSSGMANAGRVKHHLANNIEDPRNTVLIVGYCSPETPGGQLRAGNPFIKLFGKFIQVNAHVEIMDSFSAHADRGEILAFIRNQQESLKKLYLVHGTIERQEPFRTLLFDNGFKKVEIPELGDEIEL